MIRTKMVELSMLEATAYRQKLKRGKSGIIIIRYDTAQPGIAVFKKGTDEAEPTPGTPEKLFPKEAFDEAVELTIGLPYARRTPIKLTSYNEEAGTEEESPEELATVCSDDYAAFVRAYTNKKGELSYDLLNKDFIQFAKSSKVVARMVSEMASVEEIRGYVLRNKLETLTGNQSLTDDEINRIVEMLDEVSPRGVFKEVNSEIRKMLSRK